MKSRIAAVISLIALSLVYWAIVASLELEALLGPCGLAPEEWCESRQKRIVEALDGHPVEVLAVGIILYLLFLTLFIRKLFVRDRKTK